ncbi:hypothetical protein MchiMG62_18660 [Methanoculleus chikugoensis]|uniref:Uncharacterized protein n=1 Tax=Methanoculleus chikugoensis TaxID=118126 RepID=A0ABM7H7D8_9EURY|nr:hypothetical protein MchiMG62_18660 [Methanoculleus chikugoensis]
MDAPDDIDLFDGDDRPVEGDIPGVDVDDVGPPDGGIAHPFENLFYGRGTDHGSPENLDAGRPMRGISDNDDAIEPESCRFERHARNRRVTGRIGMYTGICDLHRG